MSLLSFLIVFFASKLVQGANTRNKRPTVACFCIPQNPQVEEASSNNDRRICFIDDEFQRDSQRIASSLSIPVSSELPNNVVEGFTHALKLVPFESDGISTFALGIERLSSPDKKGTGKKSKKTRISNPFYFVDLSLGKREGADLLVKAVAPKRCAANGQEGAVVYDLTAGLGQDSLVLALNGASKVYMVERDVIVAALLKDALRRISLVSSKNKIACLLAERLHLLVGDAKDVVMNMMQSNDVMQADVVYLDPMFPPRTKSAAVKKGMQMLHGLLDSQLKADEESLNERLSEEQQLLETAIQSARARVVVKRPIKALPLGGGGEMTPRPSYAVQGSTNRWDIYISNIQSNS